MFFKTVISRFVIAAICFNSPAASSSDKQQIRRQNARLISLNEIKSSLSISCVANIWISRPTMVLKFKGFRGIIDLDYAAAVCHPLQSDGYDDFRIKASFFQVPDF